MTGLIDLHLACSTRILNNYELWKSPQFMILFSNQSNHQSSLLCIQGIIHYLQQKHKRNQSYVLLFFVHPQLYIRYYKIITQKIITENDSFYFFYCFALLKVLQTCSYLIIQTFQPNRLCQTGLESDIKVDCCLKEGNPFFVHVNYISFEYFDTLSGLGMIYQCMYSLPLHNLISVISKPYFCYQHQFSFVQIFNSSNFYALFAFIHQLWDFLFIYFCQKDWN